MIMDALAADATTLDIVNALTAAGRLKLLVTSVTQDQLSRVRDPEWRAQLQSLPYTVVGTAGFALGYSRLGVDRLGPAEPAEAVRRGRLKETEDALIAATAKFDDLTLVTEDRRLRTSTQRPELALDILGWPEFRQALHDLDVTERPSRG
jgi:predicted nucleic acid-binding protein